MALFIVALGVALLLFLMMTVKLDGFTSLILTSLFVGLMEGMPLAKVAKSIFNGMGSQLSSLVLILAFGAMVGKLMADSGAAQRIATTFIAKFGIKRVQWAMLLTSFIVGVTMFFEAGFIMIIPIVYTIVKETKLPLIQVGLPAVIGLSTTHSFLPPHPGPAAVSVLYNASMGKTLFYGLIIAIPCAILVGVVYTRSNYVKSAIASIPEGLVSSKVLSDEEMPGFASSMFVALTPVVLMAAATFGEIFLPHKSKALVYLKFFGDGPIALMITALIAMYTLGIARGKKMDDVVKACSNSIKGIAMILIVIGAGGSFKQVIVDAGVANVMKQVVGGLDVSPIVLAWIIAALIRVAVGSATVAITTASGIILPIVATSGVSPELMVLATSCGSVFASHVNDPGFWMFKEYFGISVGHAIKVRTMYTCILAVLGLIGVLALNAIGF